MIKVQDLEFYYGNKKILDNISFEVESGEILGILGPNGSGKTTLLNVLNGVLKKKNGDIFIKNKKIEDYSRKELAKIMAILPQDMSPSFDFTVYEIVSMGRYPHLGLLDSFSEKDEKMIENAMEITDVLKFKNKSIREISGGERQRVFIARAIAQEPEIILLDEPTSNLDLKYQIEILDIIEKMRKEGKTIIISMHDVNLAIKYCSRLALLSSGKIYAIGKPDEIIDEKSISEVYGIEGKIIRNGNNRIVFVLPEKFNGSR